MVNPLGHWLWVLFCTSYRIPLRGLSGSWGIGFLIPLRGLSGFQVPPRIISSIAPSPGPSLLFLSVFYIFFHCFYISGSCCSMVPYQVVFCDIVCQVFSFPLPRICGNSFVGFCLCPDKISFILLKIFFALPFP